jgi:bacillolysin
MRSLRGFFLILGLLFLCTCQVQAAPGEKQVWGTNLLRNNPSVSTYRESANGVAEYVEGTLAAPVRSGEESQAAISFLQTNRGAFRIDNAAEELSVRGIVQDDLGMKHVRLDQRYQGLKVIGRELVAHFTADGTLKTVNGKFEPGIDVETIPKIASQTAATTATDDLATFFAKANPTEPELVIFPWEGTNYLAWRMFLYSDTPDGRWEYFINAATGEVIFKANRIMNTAAIGTGIGVMGTARNHIDTDLNVSTYQMRDNTRQAGNNPHGHDGQMPPGSYLQCNIASTTLPGSIATDADNVWNASAQAPAVDGQVYSALVYDWWLRVFNRNGYDNAGSSMLTVVNYSAEGNNNAYWDGQRIVIWSYSSGWRSLAGCPDVIAHEWGHAITERESNLAYQMESGALNESFSDMMGAAFEFAHDTMDVPDWFMGENGQTSGVAFRSMSDPHTFGDPDYYGTSDPYWVDVNGCYPSSFNDYCGVHTNSGVGNKWFYLLSDGGIFHGVTVTGVGVANAIKIAYRANTSYWTSSTDYANAALGTVSAANDLDPTGTWTTQVALAWTAVGVPVPGPSLTFTYPDGRPALLAPNQPTSFSVVVAGSLGGIPVSGSGKLYYSIDGGALNTVSMSEPTPDHYTATLPALACNGRVSYYISAQETTTGVKYDPDPSQPLGAIAATSTVVSFSDNFQTDKGWTVSGNATAGAWQRGAPVGGGDRGDPATDYDGSGSCYLTGNTDGDSDVDGGTTYLVSPAFDLTMGNGRINYARWYSNSTGADPNNDLFKVYISNNNGTSWTLVETVGPATEASGGWYVHELWANDFVTATNQMKLRFEASDLGTGSVVEAAVDAVTVTAYQCGSTPLEITTPSLPDWTAGVPYSQQLQASGGTGSLTWSDSTGSLTGTGLTLSSAGLVSGTPNASFTVTLIAKVVDEIGGSAQKSLAIHVNASITIVTSSLAEWTVNHPYSSQLQATGGTGTLVWADKYGNLASKGLSLSSSGLLSGTPNVSGNIAFTARVNDQVGGSKEKAYTIPINTEVAISTGTLPDQPRGKLYSQQLTATGGTGAKTWSDQGGSLAGSGLVLSAGGLLTGTPPTSGQISFTGVVADIAGSHNEKPFSFIIYVCGDADNSASVDISDVVYLLAYIFSGGSAPTPLGSGDANCSGGADISDVVHLISYIFSGGEEPCAACK